MLLKLKSNVFLSLLLILSFSFFLTTIPCKASTELEGIWQDTCQQVVQDGDLKNQIATFIFSGDTAKIERVDYQDKNCSTKFSSLVLTSTFTISGKSNSIPGAKNLDYTVISVEAIFHNKAGVNLVNKMNFCGYSDWQVNVTKDITGAPGINSKGDKLYDIYKIEDGNKLYIGSNEAVGSATRPTSLRAFYATKQ